MYMMDEASFLGLPVKTEQNNTFSAGYEDISEEKWFVEAQNKEGKMAVTRNREMRRGNEFMISFSRYLKYPLLGNEDYYAITINIDHSFFEQLERQVCEEGEFVFLLDDQGNDIYFGNNEAYCQMVKAERADEQEWFKIALDGISYIGIQNKAEKYAWTMLKILSLIHI